MFSPSKILGMTVQSGGKIWVGPVATSKVLNSPHSHIKGMSSLKACWADMPYVYWEEHCNY